jgi:RNA polymerase sigma-70 factor (ECF subfamily)
MSDDPNELAGLLEGVRRRDETAATRLVGRLYPLVSRIVRAHRPREMAHDDLCQEVFMSVFAGLGQYRGVVPFEHWVSRVAVNTCIDQLRRKRARPEIRWADLGEGAVAALEATLAETPAPSAGQAGAARELVGQVLERLDPQDRLVIQWMELEDRSVSEVRTLTGWSASLVKVRAFRARRKMRKALERILRKEAR